MCPSMLQEREAPGTVRASAESATLANVRPGAIDATRTAWLKPPHAPGRPGNVRWRDHVDGYAGDAEGFRGSSDKSTRVGNLLLDC